MPNKPVKIIMLTGYLGAGKTRCSTTSSLTTAASAPP